MRFMLSLHAAGLLHPVFEDARQYDPQSALTCASTNAADEQASRTAALSIPIPEKQTFFCSLAQPAPFLCSFLSFTEAGMNQDTLWAVTSAQNDSGTRASQVAAHSS